MALDLTKASDTVCGDPELKASLAPASTITLGTSHIGEEDFKSDLTSHTPSLRSIVPLGDETPTSTYNTKGQEAKGSADFIWKYPALTKTDEFKHSEKSTFSKNLSRYSWLDYRHASHGLEGDFVLDKDAFTEKLRLSTPPAKRLAPHSYFSDEAESSVDTDDSSSFQQKSIRSPRQQVNLLQGTINPPPDPPLKSLLQDMNPSHCISSHMMDTRPHATSDRFGENSSFSVRNLIKCENRMGNNSTTSNSGNIPENSNTFTKGFLIKDILHPEFRDRGDSNSCGTRFKPHITPSCFSPELDLTSESLNLGQSSSSHVCSGHLGSPPFQLSFPHPPHLSLGTHHFARHPCMFSTNAEVEHFYSDTNIPKRLRELVQSDPKRRQPHPLADIPRTIPHAEYSWLDSLGGALSSDRRVTHVHTSTEGSLRSPQEGSGEWPAWVYCTRYSDRPTTGSRSRRFRRQKPSLAESYGLDSKRPRTAFTDTQLSRLREEFRKNHYLTEDRRKSLSWELGLGETQVKIWFQNKRAKLKKSTESSSLSVKTTGGPGHAEEQMRRHGLYCGSSQTH